MNTKKISTEFLMDKIDLCKKERNTLMIARNVSIIIVASAVFLADLGGHLNKTELSLIAIILSYFYGCLSLACISLQIAYRVTKYTKYLEIWNKYSSSELNEKEADSIKKELVTLSENKIYIIMIINSILYTAPLSIFLGLIYYIIHTLR